MMLVSAAGKSYVPYWTRGADVPYSFRKAPADFFEERGLGTPSRSQGQLMDPLKPTQLSSLIFSSLRNMVENTL